MNLDKQLIESKAELFSFIMKKTNGDLELTEDIYQELFIKVNSKVANGKYIEQGKPLGWIKRIASNLVIDYYRKRARSIVFSYDKHKHSNTVPLTVLDLNPIDDEPYLDTFVTDEMSEKLKVAIGTLPEPQRDLIHMRFFRNMTYKEIIIETGEKQSNLLPRMHYAIKKLRKQLC